MDFSEKPQEKLKPLIERLTAKKRSVFLETLYCEAGEMGIGESLVDEGVKRLIAENFIVVPFKGVIKRNTPQTI